MKLPVGIDGRVKICVQQFSMTCFVAKAFNNEKGTEIRTFPGCHCSHKIHCITVNCWHFYSLQTTFGFAPSGRNCLPLTLFRWVLFTTDIIRQVMLTARHFSSKYCLPPAFFQQFLFTIDFFQQVQLTTNECSSVPIFSRKFLYYQGFSSQHDHSLPTFS